MFPPYVARLIFLPFLAVIVGGCDDDESQSAAFAGPGMVEYAISPSGSETAFVTRNEMYLVWDQGFAPSSTWKDHDAVLQSQWYWAQAPLGYGEAYVNPISYGPDPANKYITAYFRRDFFIEDVSQIESLRVEVMYDDGFVYYLNGEEAGRAMMPLGAVGFTTLAFNHEANNTYESWDATAQIGSLQNGWNTIAFEVHQDSPSSSDLVFDAAFYGTLQSGKLLIYHNSPGDSPHATPQYVANNKAFLETQPFQGLAIYVWDYTGINPSYRVLSETPVSYGDVAVLLDPIRNLTFNTLKNNYALAFCDLTPDLWSGNWTVVAQNFANFAKAIKEAGLKGVLFDNEDGVDPRWGNFPGTDPNDPNLPPWQAQAQLRGKQVMQAMVSEFPDISVITLHGPYISEPSAPHPLFPNWNTSNELLGPFFVGFREAMLTNTENVDGGELYHLRSTTEFTNSYNWRKNTFANEAEFVPQAFKVDWGARTSISFGVWDRDWNRTGWPDMELPALTSTLSAALQNADRYVWFYTEHQSFLLPPGQPGAASQAWIDAVRNAQQ